MYVRVPFVLDAIRQEVLDRGARESCQTRPRSRARCALCSRESQQFIVYLKLCSRVAAVCLVDGYFARRFTSFSLSLSFFVHFSSSSSYFLSFLVYIQEYSERRFRRYRYMTEMGGAVPTIAN